MKIRRQTIIVAFFLLIAIANRLMTPAYNGYIVIFFALFGVSVFQSSNKKAIKLFSSFEVLLLVLLLISVLFVSIWNSPAVRDVLRDVGAFFAFFVGFYVIANYVRSLRLILSALSIASLFIALVTILTAFQAYMAGANAYLWRGEYVIYAHEWLPYFLVVNIALVKIHPQCYRKYLIRAIFCIIGTIVSLSRTDILLDLLLALVMFWSNWRRILFNKRYLRIIFLSLIIGTAVMPRFLALDVVQERISNGVDDDDPSLGWRFIENVAFLDFMYSKGETTQILGAGLGARIPLPAGITDFDDNTSIPLLHNSFLTLIFKFGGIGFLIFSFYVIQKIRIWIYFRKSVFRPYAWTGFWILLFVLGKGVTLQGLTEWSHLVFFGLNLIRVS